VSNFQWVWRCGCLKLAQNELPLLLKEVPLAKRMLMVFQHDRVPAHYSGLVTHHLNLTFPERWIGRCGHVQWPLRSPDLTSLDFCLWEWKKSEVDKEKINGKRQENLRRDTSMWSPSAHHGLWTASGWRWRLGSTASWWRGDRGGEVEGVVKNVGHVRVTGCRLVTHVSRRCVPIIRRWIPWRRKFKKCRKLGKKYGDKEREKGNSKMEGKSPPGGGKRAQKIFEKKMYFDNFERKQCFANTYVVSRCGRGVWYILLRNVGKIEQQQQQQVVSTPPLWRMNTSEWRLW